MGDPGAEVTDGDLDTSPVPTVAEGDNGIPVPKLDGIGEKLGDSDHKLVPIGVCAERTRFCE